MTLTRTETFECPATADLDIRVRHGDVDVLANDAPFVRVVLGTPETSEPADAEPPLLDDVRVTFVDSKLLVRASQRSRGREISVRVEAPSGSSLGARAHRGAISLRGPLSDVNAATGEGPVSVELLNGAGRIATGAGAVRLGRVSGSVRARSGSGDVELDSLHGNASIATGRGDVRLGSVDGDAKVRTGGGAIVVSDAGRGSLKLATGSGDLRVGIRAGASAELDLVSGHGIARSDLDVESRPLDRQPDVRVWGRTGSGDAVVERVA
jgi:hypothetical protein